MLRRRRSPAARWTGLTPARRRTWRCRQAACAWTARVRPSWACAGRRSLRRIFPEGATPNHCRRLGGGDGCDGAEAGEQRRPHEPLDDLVVHHRQPTSDGRSSAVEPGADGFDHETLGLLVLLIALRKQLEDPAGED